MLILLGPMVEFWTVILLCEHSNSQSILIPMTLMTPSAVIDIITIIINIMNSNSNANYTNTTNRRIVAVYRSLLTLLAITLGPIATDTNTIIHTHALLNDTNNTNSSTSAQGFPGLVELLGSSGIAASVLSLLMSINSNHVIIPSGTTTTTTTTIITTIFSNTTTTTTTTITNTTTTIELKEITIQLFFKFVIVFGSKFTYQLLTSTNNSNNINTNNYKNNSYIRLLNEVVYSGFKKILKGISRGSK